MINKNNDKESNTPSGKDENTEVKKPTLRTVLGTLNAIKNNRNKSL
jgi:hypothetical protein